MSSLSSLQQLHFKYCSADISGRETIALLIPQRRSDVKKKKKKHQARWSLPRLISLDKGAYFGETHERSDRCGPKLSQSGKQKHWTDWKRDLRHTAHIHPGWCWCSGGAPLLPQYNEREKSELILCLNPIKWFLVTICEFVRHNILLPTWPRSPSCGKAVGRESYLKALGDRPRFCIWWVEKVRMCLFVLFTT